MPAHAPDVLIVTEHYDRTADFLIPFLEEAGFSWVRWDPGSVPIKARVGMGFDGAQWSNIQVTGDDDLRIELNKVGVVWYRRPSATYAPSDVPTEDIGTFLNRECAEFVGNLWRCIGRPIVNDPLLGDRASHKAVQLTDAQRLGFRTPRTYMGNDPEAIRALWRQTGGRMVVKGFFATIVDLEEEGERSLFTTPVEEGDLADDATLAACPSIWQEHIDKKVEIRATVLGDQVLAAEIHSQESEKAKHDWRNLDLDNTPHYPHRLPDEVAERCVSLVRDLGLHFGALDLIFTPQDQYVFLEINPFGQWAWVQEMCGLPLAEAHCSLFRELIDGVR